MGSKDLELKDAKILYLEDDVKIQTSMEKTLLLMCNRVYLAQNSKDAYELFKNCEIDIIISDVNLQSDMSGLDFVETVRKTDLDIPIIVLSAYTDTDYLLYASKLKLVEYLVKPISFPKLKDVLEMALHELKSNINTISFRNAIQYNMDKKVLFEGSKLVHLTNYEITFLNTIIKSHLQIHKKARNLIDSY